MNSQLKQELETLRKTNAELIAKASKRKDRIAELETQLANAQASIAQGEAKLKEVTVSVPLRRMAEEASTVPDLFLDQLTKHYKVEAVDGKLTIQTQDGKPITDKDGRPVPFESLALVKFLTSKENPQAKIFSTISIASRASGAARPPEHISKPSARPSFGLR